MLLHLLDWDVPYPITKLENNEFRTLSCLSRFQVFGEKRGGLPPPPPSPHGYMILKKAFNTCPFLA